jgi:ligand-binding sensor domain-containing protein
MINEQTMNDKNEAAETSRSKGKRAWNVKLVALGAAVALLILGELAFQWGKQKGWTTYTTRDGLAHNHATAIAVASDGALWFGTRWGGVSLFDGQTWTTYTTDDGLADNAVLSIAVSPDDALWLGTWQGGVSRFDGETWTTYTTADGLVADNNVRSIAVAPDGLADNDVRSIAVAPDGALWFGTEWGGVSRFDGQTWTTYTPANLGLARVWVSALAVDGQGRVWVGTDKGLSVFDERVGLPVQTVQVLAQARTVLRMQSIAALVLLVIVWIVRRKPKPVRPALPLPSPDLAAHPPLQDDVPADPHAAFERGRALLNQGQREAAVAHFLAVFRDGPPDLRRRALAELEKLGEVETH